MKLGFKETYLSIVLLLILITASCISAVHNSGVVIGRKDGTVFRLLCPLPEYRNTVPRLMVQEIPISREEAKDLAAKLAGFIHITNIAESEYGELEVKSYGGTMFFHSYTSFATWGIPVRYGGEVFPRDVLVRIADEFKERVLSCIPLGEIILFVDYVGEGSTSEVDGNKTIHSMVVDYGVRCDEYEIKGARLGVEIVHSEVSGFWVNLPKVTKQGEIVVTVTPWDALRKLVEGELFDTGIYPKYPLKDEIVIKEIKLAYYYDRRRSINGTQELPIVYVMEEEGGFSMFVGAAN